MKGAAVAASRPGFITVGMRQRALQTRYIEDILPGLFAPQKTIDPKYFYDQRGCKLFEQITATRDYYVTRAEIEIFQQHAAEIANIVGRNSILIEPGAGNCEKVAYLLPQLLPAVYMPMDIAAAHLRTAVARLGANFPWLNCMPMAAEFDQIAELPVALSPQRRVVFFPGSTVGNFEPEAAIDFLRSVRRIVDVEGGLLIGVDLEKDTATLERAYNDSQGITARFNLNILDHVNQLTGSDFSPDNFQHLARYNETERRIEMYLRSQCDQQVTMGGHTITFRRDERLHTENSYKYSTAAFAALAAEAGFIRARTWQDREHLFALHYFVGE